MLKQIDQLLVRAYLKAYFVCLVSLLSLYVVVDLFTNVDEFTRHGGGALAALGQIGVYYGYRVPQFFDRLCEAIVLLAAMFTVAWMQRSNELLPLLSAGVSARRVVLPVLVCSFVMVAAAAVNQELLIPRIGGRLLYNKDDPEGEDAVPVQPDYEPFGLARMLIHGNQASRKDMLVRRFTCTIPEEVAGTFLHLDAQEARYIPTGSGPRGGGWLLTGTTPAELERDWASPVLEQLDTGKYFLRTRVVTFDSLTRAPKWYNFVSTARLYRELQNPETMRLASMATLFHMRLTRPLLGVILVAMGLSVILRDQNRNVFLSAGMCLVLCGAFFAVGYGCKMLGDNNYLAPALAAWLPVLCFGPVSVVLFDAVHT